MKKAIITGGTKGLGLALATRLAKENWQLWLGHRKDQENAQRSLALLQEISDSPIHLIQADLSTEEGIHSFYTQLSEEEVTFDAYVHNAAATVFTPLMNVKDHQIDKTYNLTVKSLLMGMQKLKEKMSDGAVVLTVSGMDTLKNVPYHGLLAAAKASLETLTQYLAFELAPKITVVGINPGALPTESLQKYLGPKFGPMMNQLAKTLPRGESPDLASVVDIMEFLLSPKSKWLLGQTLVADGGQDFSLPELS